LLTCALGPSCRASGGRSQAFDIVRALSNAGELLTSEGTIYPLLARLRKE